MSAGATVKPIIGLKCKSYLGPAGLTFEQLVIPANEMKLIRTADLSLTKEVADGTMRGSEWALDIPTLKRCTVSGEMLAVSGAKDYDMFMWAFLNDGATVSMFVSDGFGEGLFGDFAVSEMSQSQPLTDVVVANFNAAPSIGEGGRTPVWMKTTVGMGPVITSAPYFSGTAGTAGSFQLTADPAATTWAATGLPPGMTINATSGEIDGTVTDPGVWWPYITAENASGTSYKIIQIVMD